MYDIKTGSFGRNDIRINLDEVFSDLFGNPPFNALFGRNNPPDDADDACHKNIHDPEPRVARKKSPILNQKVAHDDFEWEPSYDPIDGEPDDGEPEDDDDDPPYIHEPDVIMSEDDEPEDEDEVEAPPSIFERMDDGEDFKDMFAKPPTPPRPEAQMKHPYVFVANRMTFLMKTKFPVIWDTSSIALPHENCIFVALDKWRNPMMDLPRAAEIAHMANCDDDISSEIRNYLAGTKWQEIYVMPHTMEINGESRMGFLFTVIEAK